MKLVRCDHCGMSRVWGRACNYCNVFIRYVGSK